MKDSKTARLKIVLMGMVLCAGSLRAGETILSNENLKEIDQKVEKLVKQMTFAEKMSFLHGDKEGLKYDGPPTIPRLNIPAYVIAHGPYSARATFTNEETGRRTITPGTFMSVSMNFAASWDPELVQQVAQGVGKEIRSAGDYSLAGPAFNIVRDLRCGRSTEYFTEDPYLNARSVVPFVKGLQGEQVIATLKHFACNNQESSRGSIDVQVSKRALNEIYLPGFEYAVTEADAMSVMSAYNKVNGKWCAENPYLLDDRLRKTWGFKGFVMSDWSGTHSTVDSVKAGLDLEMPRARWYGKKLNDAVDSGEVSRKLIDERVSNILRTMFVAKCFDPDFKNPSSDVFKSDAMKALALDLGLNSIVLLKNENQVLPLDPAAVKRIAVIGPHSEYGPHFNEGKYDYTLFQEGGSANVKPDQQDMVTPLRGIRDLLGDAVDVVYSPGVYAEAGCGPIDTKYLKSKDGTPGLTATYFSDKDFGTVERTAVDPTVSFQWDKDPLVPEAGRKMGSKARFSVRWEGELMVPEAREYTFEIRHDGFAALYIDGNNVFQGNGNNDVWWHQATVTLSKGAHDLTFEYRKTAAKGIVKLWWDYENVAWTRDAVALARSADAVILNVGNTGNMEREGRDRFQGLELSAAQQHLIQQIAQANPKTVVVTFTAGVTMESWADKVPAIFSAFYPGEQAGNALARLIFGKANPCAKMPVTLPKSVDQYPEGHWTGPGESIGYREGIFVGYRWFDEKNMEPQFPFGHGLSYTTFAYGEPKVQVDGQTATVTLDITNSGTRAGAEVVQLYVHDVKSSVPRPPKELKAFKKVMLNPGETKTVTLQLDNRSFAFFDEASNDWTVEKGAFELLIGSSSRDIRREVSILIK